MLSHTFVLFRGESTLNNLIFDPATVIELPHLHLLSSVYSQLRDLGLWRLRDLGDARGLAGRLARMFAAAGSSSTTTGQGRMNNAAAPSCLRVRTCSSWWNNASLVMAS